MHTELPMLPEYTPRNMPFVPEATSLVSVGNDALNREFFLEQDTAAAWLKMQAAAREDGVTLMLISAFRSIARQREIVLNKLAKGMTLPQVLKFSAYPGYSEHHSGRAIDIGTEGCPHLEADFEDTAAFAWLKLRAAEFGFSMSYPRENSAGIGYEPWHWCHRREDLLAALMRNQSAQPSPGVSS